MSTSQELFKICMKIAIYFIGAMMLFMDCDMDDSGKKASRTNLEVNAFSNKEIDESSPILLTIERLQSVKLSDLFSIEKIIPLDDKSLVGQISQILQIEDGSVLIFDQRVANSLICFDLNGRFKWQIDKQKGEVGAELYLTDVKVNHSKHEINIWDNVNKRLSIFDYAGAFVKSYPINIGAINFGVLRNDRIAFYKGNFLGSKDYNFKILVYDLQAGGICAQYFPIRKNEHYITLLSPRNLNGSAESNKHFFTEPFSNGIYSISDKVAKLEFIINFEEHGLPDDFFSEVSSYENFRELANEISSSSLYHRMIHNVNEFGQFVSFVFRTKDNDFAHSFYNIKSKNHYSLTITDDIFGKLLFPNYFGQEDGEGVYFSFIYPSLVHEQVRIKRELNGNEEFLAELQDKFENLYEIYDSTEEFDNPVVVKLKLNQNMIP